MEGKSKRLNYIIASEIVNGIKSKITNKTNVIMYIVCQYVLCALQSQSKRPVWLYNTHVKTFL